MAIQYTLNKKISWHFEAACLIKLKFVNRIEEIKTEHSNDDNYAPFLSGPFHRYGEYLHNVLEEASPLMDEFPLLSYYGKPDEEHTSILADLIRSIPENEVISLPTEERKRYILQYISSELSDVCPQEAIIEFEDLENIPKELTSITEFLNMLTTLSIDDAKKMQLINLYQNYNDLFDQFMEYAAHVVPIMQKYYPMIEPDILPFMDEVLDTNYVEEILLHPNRISILSEKCCIAHPNLIDFNMVTLRIHGSSNLLTIGIFVKTFMELKNQQNFERTHAAFKALGDPTRLRIMQCLAQESMYIQELAKELGLTPATISHHMNTLFHAELVSIIVDDNNAKKVFYEPNSKAMEQLISVLSNLQRS